jgi:hypothetical protein
MSEPVIAREPAEAEVRHWAEVLGSDMPALPENVVQALMAGRILFDETAETFRMTLRSPIALENGSTIKNLILAEPTALQLRDASKATKDEMEIMTRLLSYITGIEGGVGTVQRLKQRDLLLAGALLGFFA